MLQLPCQGAKLLPKASQGSKQDPYEAGQGFCPELPWAAYMQHWQLPQDLPKLKVGIFPPDPLCALPGITLAVANALLAIKKNPISIIF